MDVENILKELRRAERYCLNDYSRMAGEAATALSTLQAENEKLREMYQKEKSVCTFCRFNPPSSSDGKPCCMCPAEAALRREQE